MAIVQDTQGFKFIAQNGRLGRPNGVGLIKAGWSRYGEFMADAGIYRRDGRWNKQRIVRCVHYKCQNLQKEKQQIWRGNFRNGVTAYHALDAGARAIFEKEATKHRMSGFNWYMSRYLRNLL
jgi:hypothetical protein